MSVETFKVYDTELGTTLENIKNNNIITYKPLVVSSSKTLGINEFIQAFINGLAIDCSSGNITLTTPNAQEIIEALGQLVYTNCYLTINAFDSTNPSSTNTFTLNFGTGVVLQDDQTTFTFNTNTGGSFVAIIYSLSPPKVVFS